MQKNIFITGASTGIGKGLALYYAQRGNTVGISARRETLLNDIVQNNHSIKGRLVPCPADVQNKSSIQDAIKQFEKDHGPIDILIANAGISVPSPTHEISSENYERVIQTNLFGAIYAYEAVIPNMIKRKHGQLVSISSLAAYRGLPESGAYCASKAALSALTESMRLDLKKHNIRVSLIHPGFIKTPLTDRNQYYMPCLLSTDKGVRKIAKAIERKKAIYTFPWPLGLVVRLGRLMPTWLYDRLLKNRRNVKSL